MGTIYLIRHAQASFGSSDYDQLSKLGHEQSKVLGQALRQRGFRPDSVYCGALQRHRETAQACLQALCDVPPSWQEDARLNEFAHENVIEVAEPRYRDRLTMMSDMAADGDPRRAFQRFFQSAVSKWVCSTDESAYAEPWPLFKRRVLAAFEQVVMQTSVKGQALVFTSGGPISVVVAHLLRLSDEQVFEVNWTLANTGITKVVLGREKVHLATLNEHAHLEGASSSLLTYR